MYTSKPTGGWAPKKLNRWRGGLLKFQASSFNVFIPPFQQGRIAQCFTIILPSPAESTIATATSYPSILDVSGGTSFAKPSPIQPVEMTSTIKCNVSILVLCIHETLYLPPLKDRKFAVGIGGGMGMAVTEAKNKRIKKVGKEINVYRISSNKRRPRINAALK